MLVTRRPVLITADVQIVPSQGAHSVGTQRSKPTWVLAHSRGIGECIRIELGEPAATKPCRHTHLRDARPSAGQMKIEHRCLEPKGDIRVTAGRTLEKVRRNLSRAEQQPVSEPMYESRDRLIVRVDAADRLARFVL